MTKLAGMLLLLTGIAGVAMAGFAAPEIDPRSGVGALVMLSGAVLVMRGRRKK